MTLESTLERIAVALESLATASKPLGASTPAPIAAPAPAPIAAPAPAPAAALWASQAEVNNYVMASYKEMGPEKGAQIGTVLNNMGLKAVTDLKPEHYEAFHNAVETLKNA